jgi:hypothetical protein
MTAGCSARGATGRQGTGFAEDARARGAFLPVRDDCRSRWLSPHAALRHPARAVRRSGTRRVHQTGSDADGSSFGTSTTTVQAGTRLRPGAAPPRSVHREARYEDAAVAALRLMRRRDIGPGSSDRHSPRSIYLGPSYEIAIVGEPKAADTKALLDEVVSTVAAEPRASGHVAGRSDARATMPCWPTGHRSAEGHGVRVNGSPAACPHRTRGARNSSVPEAPPRDRTTMGDTQATWKAQPAPR